MEQILNVLTRTWARFPRDESGQGLVEYSMIILFVCIACIVAVGALGDATLEFLWNRIIDVLIPIFSV